MQVHRPSYRSALAAIPLMGAMAVHGAAPALAAGAIDGKTAFNNSCRTCHALDAGDNRLGPSLHAIVGKKAGTTEGYQFSSAMKSAGFEWSKEKLAAFIDNPEAVVPGNNMKPYAGVKEQSHKDAIVDFLAGGAK